MLSIIIPCYNDQMVLPRAVNSALAQKCTKEIIIIDDGSKEPINNIWGSPVRVLRHKQNRGLSNALNTGILHSKGDRFVILASDDELHPDYAKYMLPVDADIVSSHFQANGKTVATIPGRLDIYKTANCHSYAALVRKSVWEKVGGFNPYMNPSWEDYEFFLHAAKKGAQWKHVDKPLHIYHRNPGGRDAAAQGMDIYLRSVMSGFHQDVFGKGAGVVTFVIPCYNQAQYLETALRSVFEQSYPHVTAVVVDDCSPDDVEGTVAKFDWLPKGKCIGVRHTENLHLSAARNTGIRMAGYTWGSQWIVPLDADDAVAPSFVTQTMSHLRSYHEYAYTDVQFIGDAWHIYKLKKFDCAEMHRKHQHPCTILMPSKMFVDIVQARGHGYDERMKEGFEDWDYALGAIGAGYCGTHVNKPLFHYRFHKDGSMRMEANKIKDKLGNWVRSKVSNSWTRSKMEVDMACRTCGKGYTRVIPNTSGVGENSYYVSGLGDIPGDTILIAYYAGPKSSTQTKLGSAGKVYHYSNDPNGTYGPEFEFFARDIHLFVRGGFTFRRPVAEDSQPALPIEIQAESSLMQNPAVVPAEEVQPMIHETEVMSFETLLEEAEEVVEAEEVIEVGENDLKELKWVGKVTEIRLKEAGIMTFEDVESADLSLLMTITGMSEDKANEMQLDAVAKAL